MVNDLMRYDLRIQAALRGAVRNALVDVARNGLPGEHHFFIGFKTGAPGVKISQRLHDQYPDEMTIVLQHQFWDLHVGERDFEVGLSFKNIGEKLVIPFDAITSFMDPYIQFALKFEVDTQSSPAAETPGAEQTRPAVRPAAKPAAVQKKPDPAEPLRADSKSRAKTIKVEDAGADVDRTEAKVIALDAFRKKTD